MKIERELRCDFCRFFREKAYSKRNRHHRRIYKWYCKHYGIRLRNLVRTNKCACFANIKPRKDGHTWKTFTFLDLQFD